MILSMSLEIDWMLFFSIFRSTKSYKKSDVSFELGRLLITYSISLKIAKSNWKVIEINSKHAEWFSQEFPHLHIVQGDGTAKDIFTRRKCSAL